MLRSILARILNRSTDPTNKFSQQIQRFCTSQSKTSKTPINFEHVNIGQPTPFSHPHLFKSRSEATPGITHAEYANRRKIFMKSLNRQQPHEHHLVILTASDVKTMSNDIPYPFHQDVDFLYLTGLNEPDAIAVFEISESKNLHKFLLFVKPKDPHKELWDGSVAGEQAAVEYFNADEAFPLRSFYSTIQERYGSLGCYVWLKKSNISIHHKNEKKISEVLSSNNFLKRSLEDARYPLQMQRLLKSPAEFAQMQETANIGAAAFMEAIRSTVPGITEGQLHALLEYECKIRGAQFLSFPPVVAGGNRANTLHYINNDQVLNEREMVLMDGGCILNGYPCDITRTWPVSGKFSDAQRTLYEIVLRVQKACLEKCTSNISINHLHHFMLTYLGEELQDLGLLDKHLKDLDLQRAASRFCPHHLGHYLGMDTHDTPLMNRGLPLKQGMAFTLEPGLYISEDSVDLPEKYRGIGIRIEDNVLMTEQGPHVLTSKLPKNVVDIEELASEKCPKQKTSSSL